MSDRVIINIENQIAYVMLNRADKHNGMDYEMLNAVVGAQKTLRKQKDIRAVIIHGDGPSLCAGLDFKSASKNPWRSFFSYLKLWLPWINLYQKWSMGWRKLSVPVIAVMHGNCFGAGLQLALGADIRVSTPDAKMSFMEAKWGLVPDMGGVALMRELTTIDIAKELTMTGRVIGAQDGKDIGLVTHITDDPLTKAKEICQEIMTRSPDAVSAGKKMLQLSWLGSEYNALQQERSWQKRLLRGRNNRIAVKNALAGEKQPYKVRSV